MGAKLQHTETTQLIVRQALPEDAIDVLRWRNDPLVCAMSRHHDPINEVAHVDWYSKAIGDPNRLLLIGVLGEQKIGIIRFDHQQASLWEVSILMAPEARGQGFAKNFLNLALKHLQKDHLSVSVSAAVRLNNEPSLRLFHALGFDREYEDGEFINLVLLPSTSSMDY